MKFPGECSKIIAIGLAIVFIISAFAALILYNVQSHYLNPDTFKTVLEEQEIYDRLPAIMAEQIAYSMTYTPCLENSDECEGEGTADDENNGPPSYLKNLNSEDWEQMLSLVLTPEWTRSEAESVLEQFFAFLDSNEEKLTITLSLVGLKANLTGEEGLQFIRILIDAQPPCTETILGILLDAAAGNFSPEKLLLCRPPEEIMDRLTPTMEAALEIVINDLPDRVILRKKIFGGDQNTSGTALDEQTGINFRTIRTMLRVSPFLALICLVLLTVFAVRSLMDLLFWWGIPFILLGLFTLVMGLIALPLIDWGLGRFVIDRISGVMDPSFLALLTESVELLIKSFLRVIATQAAVIAYLGITMTGAGLLTIYRSLKNFEIQS